MSESIALARIIATPAAREAIHLLRAARGGPVMFVQSGGCCAGSTPMCFPVGEFLIGDIDVLLGDIDGCPFYIDKRLDQAWHQEQFLLDVAPGEPEDFSLPAGDNLHFVTRSPACATQSASGENALSPTSEWEHTMRAAVVTDFHSPLQVQDLPIPEPGPGEVLVRIETSGLCHTDIHAAHGDWPVKPTPPFIPGHEGVGHVEKLGTGVSTRAMGDRVAIAWLGYACGECRYCNGGWETLCEKQQNSGYSVNGTFAEYAVVPAAFASPVPDGISSRDAAPLTCAGVTTYKAIKVARVAPAETVAIFGVGGLGHLALQYARIAGGFVIAVDIEDHKLTMATELGADHVVNALTTDPVEAIQALGGADVAVALAASPGAFDQAYRSLRRGGRLVCVALPADDATLSLPIFDTVINGKTVIGSIVGTRNDLADVFALHAAGRTKVIAVDRKIDEVNQSIDDVLAGTVPARVVFQF
jgi:alcohol dehydrogenase, propanol-preferring